MSDGVSHLHLLAVLYTAYYISHISCREFFAWNHVHLQHSNLVGYILHSCVEELNFVALAYGTVLYFEISYDATERVEYRVKNQCLQRLFLASLRMRYSLHHGIENVLHTLSGLAACTYYFTSVATYKVYYLVLNLVGHCTWHVYLVDDRNNLQVMVNSHI